MNLNSILVEESVGLGSWLDMESELRRWTQNDLGVSILGGWVSGHVINQDREHREGNRDLGKCPIQFWTWIFYSHGIVRWKYLVEKWKLDLEPRGNQKWKTRFACHWRNRQLRQWEVTTPPGEKVWSCRGTKVRQKGTVVGTWQLLGNLRRKSQGRRF